jgi:hypothetical protein
MDRLSSSQNRAVGLQVEALEERCVLSTAEYVTGLYSSILHRSPAPAEVAGWVDTLNAGASPKDVALAFTTSPEYSTNMIRAEYNMFLGRQPAPVEAAGWLQQLQAGAGEKQVEASFLASNEFFSLQGDSALPWLTGVYEKALGRAPDPVGLNMWSQNLQAGISRAGVALAIVDSPEADSRLVSGVYQDLLRRNPDASGLATWVAKLQQGLPPSDLVALIASSDEFIGLTAHGLLDVPITPPVPVDVAVPDATPVGQPFCDPFVGDPFSGGVTVAIDPGQIDPGQIGPGQIDPGQIDPGQSNGCSSDPGIDSSGFDTGSDGGSFGGGFDGAGSGGGADGSDS